MKTLTFARKTKIVPPTVAFFFALLSTTALPILMNPPAALAGSNTYPTSIANCKYVSGSPSGYYTCDLKDDPQDKWFDPWLEENRECTSYAAWMLSSVNGFTMPFNDDAVNWGSDASSRGYTVNMTPAVGSIYWSSSSDHVAYVESVSSDGSTVTTEDYNAGYPTNPGLWAEHTGVATSSASGYIHFKDTSGGGTGTGKPAALKYNTEMDVYKRGGDNAIWKDTWNGTSWSGWNSLGGGLASNPVTIKYGSNMYVFAIGPDGKAYNKYWNGSTWIDWSNMGTTTFTGDPAAVVYNGTELDVYARGTDGHIYKDTTFNGTSWGGFSSLGGSAAGSPAAVQYGSEMDVYMRGTDNAIWKDTWNGSSWGGFSSLGGGLVNDPYAIQYNSEMDVYAIGTDSKVYKDTWNGSNWGGWSNLGTSTMTGSPTALQYNSSEMDVYARGTDNHIYKDTWNGSSWGGFSSLGGSEASDPTAILYGSPEMDVYATNTSNNTDKDTWNGSSWGGFSHLL